MPSEAGEALSKVITPASLLPGLPAQSKILVVRLRSIGDIVLLTPALHMLKAWRPDLRLSVLVESRFREVLEGNPDVDEILTPGEGSLKVAAQLAAGFRLRRKKFAACLNLHGGPTSRFLARMSGAPIKIGFYHFRSPGQYQILIPDACAILNQSSVHTAEHQAAALFHLGLPRTEIPRARVFVSGENAAWWAKQRARLELGEYAVIHPTALYATKQWTPEGFARLANWMEHETPLKTLFTCGPGEGPVLDAVERAAARPLRRLEAPRLGQFAAALAEARLFVGNDSGPAHMAAALSRPVVVIFGSSSSSIWGPWPRQTGTPRSQVVQNAYECNPCPGDRCYRFERPECILSVTYEQVQAAVKNVLAL